MHRTGKSLVLGFALLAFGGAAAVGGDGGSDVTFDLGIGGGGDVSGRPETVDSRDHTLTMTPGGDNIGANGAQGWSISLGADGCASIVGITTEGTQAADVSAGGLRNTGFEVSETTTAFRDGDACAGDGAVSAVVLSFVMNITLDPGEMADIGVLSVDYAIPSLADSPAAGTVAYRNGCQGSGQPVDNNVTWMGQTIAPGLGSVSMECIAEDVPPDCSTESELSVFVQTENLFQTTDPDAGLIGDIDEPAAIELPSSTGGTIYGAVQSKLPGSGVQGCSIAVRLAGDGNLVGIRLDGTVAADVNDPEPGLRNTGFSVAELVDPAVEPSSGPLAGMGPQGQGAVSALVLSFVMDITLDATGAATLVCLDVEAADPDAEDVQTATLEWTNGLQGAGQPVDNVATVAGNTVPFCTCQAAAISFIPVPPQADILRGDSNDDGKVDIADPVWTLNSLFRGGPDSVCDDAADFDDNGVVDVTDATAAVSYQFQGGSAPPNNYPECGKDGEETPDDNDGIYCDGDHSSSSCS